MLLNEKKSQLEYGFHGLSFSEQYIDLAKPKSGACIFFSPHISKAQHLAPARTRTQVVQLGAQCTDFRTTEQSHGIGVPAVQLTMHVKSSTLYGHMVIQSYGRTSKFFRPDELRAPLILC